jgi:hypothetical protein
MTPLKALMLLKIIFQNIIHNNRVDCIKWKTVCYGRGTGPVPGPLL